MPEKAAEGRTASTGRKLSDLLQDEEMLVDLVANNLEYHLTLCDQVKLPNLLRKAKELSPEAIVEAIARNAEKGPK